MIGANDNPVFLVKGIRIAFFFKLVESFSFQYHGRQEKLIGQLLLPLRTQRGGQDQEDIALTLGPFLQDDDSCLDGFTKADLIGKNDALGKWRPESKQGRIHLVRVQLNARVGDGARQARRTWLVILSF